MSNENNDRRTEAFKTALDGRTRAYDELSAKYQDAVRQISTLIEYRDHLLDTLQTELECLLEDLGTAEQSAVEGLMARINRIEAVIEKAGRS